MRGRNWAPLRDIDKARLGEARLQAHHAMQWLARSARAFAPPQTDDGHTSLGWDATSGCFITHPLKDGAWLSLRVADLMLAVHDGPVVQSFALNGRRDADAGRWLSDKLGMRGFDPPALGVAAPYELPAHPIAQTAEVYRFSGVSDAFATLSAWFDNAALILESVRGQMADRGLQASAVRCWPHHFDIATLTALPTKSTGTTSYIGAGLSPGDDYYDEPYFYVSIYPKPDPATLPSLPDLGSWHTRDFTAAIATATTVVAAHSQHADTENFLHAAVEAAIRILI
jgi:hypothetical protein